jgi:SAM-dependent methyltransferase
VAGEEFEDPRLAALYDALDPDRSDLEVYAGIAAELGARRVVDLGCGTGVLALLLAGRGCEVVGVDPAAASLAVARAKPGADRVRWVEGDATAIDVTGQDLVTMTANVAQHVVGPAEWATTLRCVHAALRPGGRLVAETRDPAARAWERWTRADTSRRVDLPGVGPVATWYEVTGVDGPLVTFHGTWVLEADGTVLTSRSTLRFRGRAEVEADLRAAGFTAVEVRDAPDRPGRELVFLARA